MIRQFRAILGDDNLELTILTLDRARSAGYFRTVRQVEMPPVFPKFLLEQCPRHHGVVACEGSMFKSKFANALTTMIAHHHHKQSNRDRYQQAKKQETACLRKSAMADGQRVELDT